MNTTMGPVDIQIFDEIVEDQVITRGKLTTLGVGEHAIFKAYQWHETERRFYEYDTLSDCSVVERDNHLTLKGTSARMVEEVGVPVEQATVRWEVDLKGCSSCQ